MKDKLLIFLYNLSSVCRIFSCSVVFTFGFVFLYASGQLDWNDNAAEWLEMLSIEEMQILIKTVCIIGIAMICFFSGIYIAIFDRNAYKLLYIPIAAIVFCSVVWILYALDLLAGTLLTAVICFFAPFFIIGVVLDVRKERKKADYTVFVPYDTKVQVIGVRNGNGIHVQKTEEAHLKE